MTYKDIYAVLPAVPNATAGGSFLGRRYDDACKAVALAVDSCGSPDFGNEKTHELIAEIENAGYVKLARVLREKLTRDCATINL